MRRATACIAVLTAFIGAAFVGCYHPTEVEVEITTDIPCSANIAIETGILVGPDESLATSDRAFSTTTVACIGGKIGNIVLVPSDSRSDAIRIEIVASVGVDVSAERCRNGGIGCVVVKRRLRYRPHTSVRLPMALTGACVGNACTDPNATCFRGACIDAECPDPESCSDDMLLAANDGGTPAIPVSTPPLVTPVDAGADAAPEASTFMCAPGAGDTLIPMCHRSKQIGVPCYLVTTYLSRGDTLGACAP